MTEFDDPATGFNRRVGELLREVRKQRRLALQEVEAQTGEEFKASVVGAYERGERSLSLPRLARLAEFYEVPIGRLLPGRDAGASAADETPQHPARLMIDLEFTHRWQPYRCAVVSTHDSPPFPGPWPGRASRIQAVACGADSSAWRIRN